ncbi:MAG: SDR family NAD(P)-dependent oxidoreductase [Clostridia bacterium]|nr:SDR family NAD(P)-dependent oxidoreductase [Clostridia bacterium]
MSLNGKTVAITGATGDIGRAWCHLLAKQGASLWLFDRDAQKSAQLQAELKAAFPDLILRRTPLDLTDRQSVDAACAALCATPPAMLIHNAGAFGIPRNVCDTGLDAVFQVNFAAPYDITRRVVPAMMAQGEARVVVVGSLAHHFCKTNPADREGKRWGTMRAYGNAKRHLMFAHYELAAREGFELAVVHPGISPTTLFRHFPRWLQKLIRLPMKWLFISPAKAARVVAEGCRTATPYHTWIGPRVCGVWGKPRLRKLSRRFYDESRAVGVFADELFEKLSQNETVNG